MAAFLKNQRLRNKELTCYSFGTSALYLRLGLIPSTRFTHIDGWVYQYPSRQNTIRAELAASPERYIVSDSSYLAAQVRIADLIEEQKTGPAKGVLRLSPEVPASVRAQYPWSEPIVFRAGQYALHRSAGSLRRW